MNYKRLAEVASVVAYFIFIYYLVFVGSAGVFVHRITWFDYFMFGVMTIILTLLSIAALVILICTIEYVRDEKP